MIIDFPEIPLAIEVDRFADMTGLDREAAAAWLEIERSKLKAHGVFDEVASETLPELWESSALSEIRSAIIGLCALDIKDDRVGLPETSPDYRSVLNRLALSDALDFLEYRVRIFLKPTGREPGPRLIPGCPELPLIVNGIVLDHFGAGQSLGLALRQQEKIFSGPGLAFVYPIGSLTISFTSPCAKCARNDCPGRKGV
ncbi:MAG: hypothetical protein HQK55_17855 [Deltaproteobacteria bacterium]|nr:hypothetical protein [Deltaproteobacteria bacterium]